MSNGIEGGGDSVSPDARVKGQRLMLALPRVLAGIQRRDSDS